MLSALRLETTSQDLVLDRWAERRWADASRTFSRIVSSTGVCDAMAEYGRLDTLARLRADRRSMW